MEERKQESFKEGLTCGLLAAVAALLNRLLDPDPIMVFGLRVPIRRRLPLL